ncbi:MAG: septal ring lytic transglycosylase RlpA family protein [Methylocystis sp.]|uniref:septal ring lytic transglycosylase RlpA family protein n=1 Tax=Methylocystis sp. TaxID=1911079 RepID=UPI0039293A7B
MPRIIVLGVAIMLVATAGQAGEWVGKASYYALKGRTASGVRVGALTAAHRTLPFGSKVRVTNLRNNLSVVVTVNDRGPFTRGRVIDVSVAAAESLGFRSAGVAQVKVEPVSD